MGKSSSEQPELMIRTEGLSKSFGAVQAVRDLSFSVRRGEIFGILGPDGAGKTTLFRMLTSLMLPDGGRAEVAGLDCVRDYQQLRQIIGYMPGRFSLYQDLTIRENLEFFASVFGTSIDENYDLIAPIYQQLERFNDRRSGRLSGGMKQKLALCCALIHRPEILFLDEPTTGVDPVSRREFWDVLDNLREDGLTIVASTPYMDEASRCDRIALMQEGRFLQEGTPDEIIDSYPRPLWSVRSDQMSTLLDSLRSLPSVGSAYSFGQSYHVTLRDGFTTEELAHELHEAGHSGIAISSIRPSVEDCFMNLLDRHH